MQEKKLQSKNKRVLLITIAAVATVFFAFLYLKEVKKNRPEKTEPVQKLEPSLEPSVPQEDPLPVPAPIVTLPPYSTEQLNDVSVTSNTASPVCKKATSPPIKKKHATKKKKKNAKNKKKKKKNDKPFSPQAKYKFFVSTGIKMASIKNTYSVEISAEIEGDIIPYNLFSDSKHSTEKFSNYFEAGFKADFHHLFIGMKMALFKTPIILNPLNNFEFKKGSITSKFKKEVIGFIGKNITDKANIYILANLTDVTLLRQSIRSQEIFRDNAYLLGAGLGFEYTFNSYLAFFMEGIMYNFKFNKEVTELQSEDVKFIGNTQIRYKSNEIRGGVRFYL